MVTIRAILSGSWSAICLRHQPRNKYSHHPNPNLQDTGGMKKPYDWAPSILPIQILGIGQLFILSAPGDDMIQELERLTGSLMNMVFVKIIIDLSTFRNGLKAQV